MELLAAMAIVSYYTFSLYPSPGFADPNTSLERNTTDVFKIIQRFDHVVSIFDEDHDDDLDCESTERMELDMDTRSATYLWMFKAHTGRYKKNITLRFLPGPSPDKSLFTLDNHPTKYLAHFVYTDYKDCFVVDLPLHGNQECILWVTSGINAAPRNCIEQFDDICHIQTWAFDEETCGRER